MRRISLFVLFIFLSGRVFANDLMIGLVSNLPGKELGLTLAGFNAEKNYGLLFDIKSTSNQPSNDVYYDNIDTYKAEQIFNDKLLQTKKSTLTIDVGLLNKFNEISYVYYGAGITTTTEYKQYIDEFGILGQGGQYWIKGNESKGLNLIAGFLMLINKYMTLQIGVETNPASISLGMGGRFEI